MKKLMMAVMGAVLALGTFADCMSVEYLDENGCLQTNETAMVVTADTATLETGWYVVTGEVSRGGIDVAPGCTANLILADGASLTVQGAYMGGGLQRQYGRNAERLRAARRHGTSRCDWRLSCCGHWRRGQ